jgi:hypothetical protein
MDKTVNKIDLILLVLVTSMMVMEMLGDSAYEPLEEVGNLLLAIRYGVQLFRILSLIKQYRELRMVQKMGDISFPDLHMLDEIEGYQLHKDAKAAE